MKGREWGIEFRERERKKERDSDKLDVFELNLNSDFWLVVGQNL